MTALSQAKDALAEYDASTTQADAVLVVPEVVAALRALIKDWPQAYLDESSAIEGDGWEYGTTCPPNEGMECTYPHHIDGPEQAIPEETLWRRRARRTIREGEWEVVAS